MLRILMISPIPVQPMNAGDRVRIEHLARGLARHSDLTLVTPVADTRPSDAPAGSAQAPYRLVPVPWSPPSRLRQVQSFATRWPYHVALRYHQQLAQTVKQLLAVEPYDLLYCHFLATLPYAVDKGVPVIWDQHNVDRVYWQHKVMLQQQRPWRKLLMQWNLAKVMRLETAMLPKVAGLVTVSPTDQALMQPLLPATTPCWVAPNGVDTDYYHLATRRPAPTASRQPLVLGFFGSLDLELNQMAALTLLHKILPQVIQQLPEREVSLILLGRNPPPWLRELVARCPHPGVTLTGTVADVRPYLQQMDLLVLPLQGGAGTKLRVVEALASGVCVVGNEYALLGLSGAEANPAWRLAQEPDQFVAAICDLARNPPAQAQMRLAGRQLVVERYRWQQITQQLTAQLANHFAASQLSHLPASSISLSQVAQPRLAAQATAEPLVTPNLTW